MTEILSEEQAALLSQADAESADSEASWAAGNAGRARVTARRAAGMAIRAWLMAQDGITYGTNFMHHLAGVADDSRHPTPLRESAWRLAARGVPEGGFEAPLPDPLVPVSDARSIITWVRSELTGAS